MISLLQDVLATWTFGLCDEFLRDAEQTQLSWAPRSTENTAMWEVIWLFPLFKGGVVGDSSTEQVPGQTEARLEEIWTMCSFQEWKAREQQSIQE